MRQLMLLAVVQLTGCIALDGIDFDGWESQYDNTLYAPTRGIAFYGEANDHAHAGMYDVTCEVWFDGSIGIDDDPEADSPDHVRDAGDDGGGDSPEHSIVLTSTEDHVWVSWPWDYTDDGNVIRQRFDISGTVDAGFIDTGLVALNRVGDDCALYFGDLSGSITHLALPDCAIDKGFDVDPAGNAAWVATPSGLLRATAEGYETFDVQGDIVAWQPSASRAYVASEGGSLVTAVEIDGSVAWTSPINGSILTVADRGTMAEVSVLADSSGAAKQFNLSAADGTALNRVDLPASVDDIVVSEDGRTTAYVSADQVHFGSAGGGI